jgi:hypothetical protein
MVERQPVNGREALVSRQTTAPAKRTAELVVEETLAASHAESVVPRVEALAAEAEIERLRERIVVLESWLAAAARRRSVEYVQAQRLAMMKAVERDQRFGFVLSLPLVLLLLYCAALAGLAWLLAVGRI